MNYPILSQKFFLFFLFSIVLGCAHGQIMKGTVVDKSDLRPLPFTNIGVVQKNIGTLTNDKGMFQLNVKDILAEDTVRISYLGYKSIYFRGSAFTAQGELKIELESDPLLLDHIEIKADKYKTKTVGNKGVSGFMQTGWGAGLSGGERAIKVSENKKLFLDSIHFHIASNGYDSALVRLRIRSLKKGAPGDDLLAENIFFTVKVKKGWVNYMINQYDIVLDQDVTVGLELVKFWGSCNGYCFLLSMDVPGKAFYYKEYSFSNWGFQKLRGPSIYLSTRIVP